MSLSFDTFSTQGLMINSGLLTYRNDGLYLNEKLIQTSVIKYNVINAGSINLIDLTVNTINAPPIKTTKFSTGIYIGEIQGGDFYGGYFGPVGLNKFPDFLNAYSFFNGNNLYIRNSITIPGGYITGQISFQGKTGEAYESNFDTTETQTIIGENLLLTKDFYSSTLSAYSFNAEKVITDDFSKNPGSFHLFNKKSVFINRPFEFVPNPDPDYYGVNGRMFRGQLFEKSNLTATLDGGVSAGTISMNFGANNAYSLGDYDPAFKFEITGSDMYFSGSQTKTKAIFLSPNTSDALKHHDKIYAKVLGAEIYFYTFDSITGDLSWNYLILSD